MAVPYVTHNNIDKTSFVNQATPVGGTGLQWDEGDAPKDTLPSKGAVNGSAAAGVGIHSPW